MVFVRVVSIAAGMFICVLKKGKNVELPKKKCKLGLSPEDLPGTYFSPTAKIEDEGLKARS